MFSHETIDHIKNLMKIISENKDKELIPEDFIHGFKQGRVPSDFADKNPQFIWPILTNEDCKQYFRCLTLLTNENDLESLSKTEIENELWRLTCEVYLEGHKIIDQNRINTKLKSLQDRLFKNIKPIGCFDILILVENIDMAGYEYKLAGVTFFKMTPDLALKWGINSKMHMYQEVYGKIVNKTFCLISEKGGDPERIVKIAKEKLATAISLLRVGLLINHEPLIINWRILDEHMLFKYGEIIFVKKQGTNECTLPWLHRGFEGLELKIDDNYYKQLNKSKELIESLYSENFISGNIKEKIIRSMEWISISTTRENFDDKVVDLCTALETLLTTSTDRLKGERITIRMILLNMLLEKPFYSPAYIMYFYLKRSNIIHGSDIRICTESDYRHCQAIALDTVVKFISYVQIYKISRHNEFINSLQSNLSLVQKAVDSCKVFPVYSKDIKKAGDEMVTKTHLHN